MYAQIYLKVYITQLFLSLSKKIREQIFFYLIKNIKNINFNEIHSRLVDDLLLYRQEVSQRNLQHVVDY